MSATSTSSSTPAATPAEPSQILVRFYGNETDRGQGLELTIVNHLSVITLPPFTPLPEFPFDRYYFRLDRLELSNQGGTNNLVRLTAPSNEAVEQFRSYLTPADQRQLEQFLTELHASYLQACGETDGNSDPDLTFPNGRIGDHRLELELEAESIRAINAAISEITSEPGYNPHEHNFAASR